MSGNGSWLRSPGLVWAAGLLVLALSGAALAEVENTPHDFRNRATYPVLSALTGDQLCRACHVPHNAARDRLLRDFGDDVTSTHVFLTQSLLCLSCHDGIIAPFGPTGDYDEIDAGKLARIQPSVLETDKHFWNDVVAGYGTLEWDPNNADNPKVAGFAKAMKPGAGGQWVAQGPLNPERVLPLYNTGDGPRLACTTCHDPHVWKLGATGEKFLRSDQSYGDLCVTCHSTFYPE